MNCKDLLLVCKTSWLVRRTNYLIEKLAALDVLSTQGELLFNHMFTLVESKTRTYHGRVGAGRGRAAHGGAAGRGGAGQDGTPTGRFDQEITVPLAFQGIEDNCLKVSSEARTIEILCKPMEEQKQWCIRGLSAIDNRFIRGTAAALRSWLLTSVPSPICLCKPFSCKACP